MKPELPGALKLAAELEQGMARLDNQAAQRLRLQHSRIETDEALMRHARAAILTAWGALVELSPCAEDGCKQFQTDVQAMAEKRCKEVGKALQSRLDALPPPPVQGGEHADQA